MRHLAALLAVIISCSILNAEDLIPIDVTGLRLTDQCELSDGKATNLKLAGISIPSGVAQVDLKNAQELVSLQFRSVQRIYAKRTANDGFVVYMDKSMPAATIQEIMVVNGYAAYVGCDSFSVRERDALVSGMQIAKEDGAGFWLTNKAAMTVLATGKK